LRPQREIDDLRSRVHLFEADGLFLAFDVNSGSLYNLDEVAWQLVMNYLECGDWEDARLYATRMFDGKEVDGAFSELKDLSATGLFFSQGVHYLDQGINAV
jgi:hypothetical protein